MGGAVQVDAVASEYLSLTIQGAMVRVLGNEHMRQQGWSGESAFNRSRWCWLLNDHIALRACHLRPNMLDHFIAGRNALKNLRDIFAQLPQLAATVGARPFNWQMGVHFTGKMRQQWAPSWLVQARRVSFSCCRNASQSTFSGLLFNSCATLTGSGLHLYRA